MKRLFLILFLSCCLLLTACSREKAGDDPDWEDPPRHTAAEPTGSDPGTTAPRDPSENTLPTGETNPTVPSGATEPSETAPSAAAVKITKDPYGETLVQGGRASFIAHAENADSLTWVFVDFNGNVFTTEDTIQLNPDLKLVILDDEDMICLRNTPLSLNGWSVRARFDGPGGTATTKEALITVQDPLVLYQGVIESYRKAFRDEKLDQQKADEYGVSEMVIGADWLGYSIQDVNGDSVPELLIFGGDDAFPAMPFLCELAMLEKGAPVSVLRSGFRFTYFWTKDGKLYFEGSSGAAYSYFYTYRMGEKTLEFVEGIKTTDLADNGDYGDIRYFYSTTTDSDDHSNDLELTESSASSKIKSWQSQISVPAYTFIE